MKSSGRSSTAKLRAQAELELRRRRRELTFREYVERVRPSFRWYRHCVVLADVLQRVADGEIKRLMIFMPPRHGKSELVSRLFSGYYLYRFLERWVGIASYGADLAYTLSRASQEFFRDAGGPIKSNADAVKHWETPDGGGMWAAGVGGPMTGKGWHLGIIDDPLKNAEEAGSETIRARQREWYASTFYTREEPDQTGNPDGALVVVQTRWNEADLAGWLLEQEKGEEPERWHVVSFEAIKEDDEPKLPATCTLEPDWRSPGEALCPERRPAEKLLKIARRIGSYFWSALFQQRPQPAEGNKFKRPWFRYWRAEGPDCFVLLNGDGSRYRVVKRSECRFFATVDLAFSSKKTADYTVIAVWAVTPDSDLLLVELVRDRMSEPQFLRIARGTYHKHKLQYVAVESNGAQLGVVQTLRAGGRGEDGAHHFGLAVRAIPSHADKVTRAGTAIVRMEAGQVFLPLGDPALDEYERELLSFPTGAHDDQVDATSLAAAEVFWVGGSGVESDEQRLEREEREREEAARRRDDWLDRDNEALWTV